MRTHATSLRNWLTALLVEEQSRTEYVGGYDICVGEDGYSLFIVEATGDEEPGDRPSSQNNGDNEIIEFFALPANLLSSC